MAFDSRDPEQCEFNENWCPSSTKDAIQYSLGQIKNMRGAFIEIGCFEGHSAVFTANLINPVQLICIDPWVPQEYATYEVDAYRERDIEGIFRRNIEKGTAGNVQINKMGWEEYFAENSPPISYLYLDGPHAEANVYQSLEVIVPLIVKGGVILGDNYDDGAVSRGVDNYFGKSIPHPIVDNVFHWRKDG